VDNIIQIVTGVEMGVGNCFPSAGEIFSEATGRGKYFPTEGKLCPIMTDTSVTIRFVLAQRILTLSNCLQL